MLRVSELASIELASVEFSEGGVRFNLTKPRKSQHSGGLHSVFVKRIPDPLVDPVTCLGLYRLSTDVLRSESNGELLFIGINNPHNHVSSSTISRWIKLQLQQAGIDTSVFSAHSTRGAAASAALKNGCPINSILESAHWSSESTFTRFYRRDVVDSPSVSDAIFSGVVNTYDPFCLGHLAFFPLALKSHQFRSNEFSEYNSKIAREY